MTETTASNQSQPTVAITFVAAAREWSVQTATTSPQDQCAGRPA